MQLRDALISQAPSLELQRAAHAEICLLDFKLAQAGELLQACLKQGVLIEPLLVDDITEFVSKLP